MVEGRDRGTPRALACGLVAGAAALAVVGCGNEATAPPPTFDPTEAASMAVAISERYVAVLQTGEEEPRPRTCPLGGGFLLKGGGGTYWDEDRSATRSWDIEAGYLGCGVILSDDSPALVDGQMRMLGEAHYGPPVDGEAPLLSHESTQVGTLAVSQDGGTMVCEYDLTVTLDDAADQYRIVGTACDLTVDQRVPLP